MAGVASLPNSFRSKRSCSAFAPLIRAGFEEKNSSNVSSADGDTVDHSAVASVRKKELRRLQRQPETARQHLHTVLDVEAPDLLRPVYISQRPFSW